LRDDGANYAVALEKAGVPVIIKEYPGTIHGFFGHGFMVDDAYNLRKWLSEQLVKAVQ
jgi:acetyl esterase